MIIPITMVPPPPGNRTDGWNSRRGRRRTRFRGKPLDDLRAKCICPDCPTYNDCAKKRGELFFCSFNAGRSDCITEEKWCICETCPVTELVGLTKIYYCIKGNENEQRSSAEYLPLPELGPSSARYRMPGPACYEDGRP